MRRRADNEAVYKRWLREGRDLEFESLTDLRNQMTQVAIEFSELERERKISPAEAAELAAKTGKALRSALDRPGAPGSIAAIAGYLERWLEELRKDP